MSNPADEISQAERRRIMAEERRGRTYFGQARHADDALGGRSAKVHSTTVVGSSPISYPQPPATSFWHHDPCGQEPFINGRSEGTTLGYEIDRPEAPPTTAALVVEGVSGRPSDGDVSATQSKKPSTRIKRRM